MSVDDAVMGLVLIDGVIELATHYNEPAEHVRLASMVSRYDMDAWAQRGFTLGELSIIAAAGRGSGKSWLNREIIGAQNAIIFGDIHAGGEYVLPMSIEEYQKVWAEPIPYDIKDHARPSNGKGWYRDFERKAHGKGKRKRW